MAQPQSGKIAPWFWEGIGQQHYSVADVADGSVYAVSTQAIPFGMFG
jgi:hypothetical protein